MEASCRFSLGRRQAGRLASCRMASARHRLLIERKIEVMKVVGSICCLANSGRVFVQPLLKEVSARVLGLRSNVAEVFVHSAIVAQVQHCVWPHASE